MAVWIGEPALKRLAEMAAADERGHGAMADRLIHKAYESWAAKRRGAAAL